MPNRILKESICTSKELANISLGAEVLFYRLIVKADDFGCYHGDAEIIRNTCFAKKKSIRESNVTAWLAELEENMLIEIYINKDIPYLHLTTFSDHQQQRARNPKYPLPSDDSSCLQMKSVANPLRNAICENDMRERERIYVCDNKKTFGEFQHVHMTQEEYGKLIERYGEALTESKIAALDTNIQNGIKKYIAFKDHYATVGNWCRNEYEKLDKAVKPKIIDPCIKQFPGG